MLLVSAGADIVVESVFTVVESVVDVLSVLELSHAANAVATTQAIINFFICLVLFYIKYFMFIPNLLKGNPLSTDLYIWVTFQLKLY